MSKGKPIIMWAVNLDGFPWMIFHTRASARSYVRASDPAYGYYIRRVEVREISDA